MTNSQANVGIRRNFGTLGDRNFENSGTVPYKATREPTVFLGTTYHKGDSLTFDVTGTSYGKQAIHELRQLWDACWIEPIT